MTERDWTGRQVQFYRETPAPIEVEPVVGALQIEPDDVVFDLNPGTDRFAISMAQELDRLEGGGMVLALERDETVIEQLQVEALEGDDELPVCALSLSKYPEDNLPCNEKSADRLLSFNHYDDDTESPQELAEMHRVLKPGGMALLVRWRPGKILAPDLIDKVCDDFELLDRDLSRVGFDERRVLCLSWDYLAMRAVKPERSPRA